MVAPPKYRYYLSAQPVCVAMYLGHTNLVSQTKFSVSATCEVQYSSNSVDVTVSASEEAKIQTYMVSVMAYVQFEGQYFGYF